MRHRYADREKDLTLVVARFEKWCNEYRLPSKIFPDQEISCHYILIASVLLFGLSYFNGVNDDSKVIVSLFGYLSGSPWTWECVAGCQVKTLQ